MKWASQWYDISVCSWLLVCVVLFHHFCVCVEQLCQYIYQYYTVGINLIPRVSRYVKLRRILVRRWKVPSFSKVPSSPSTFILLVHSTVLMARQEKSVFRPFCQKSVKSITVLSDKKLWLVSVYLRSMSSRMYSSGPQDGTVLLY